MEVVWHERRRATPKGGNPENPIKLPWSSSPPLSQNTRLSNILTNRFKKFLATGNPLFLQKSLFLSSVVPYFRMLGLISQGSGG